MNNAIDKNRLRRRCFICDKHWHTAVTFKNGLYHRKNPYFDSIKDLRVTIDGNANKMKTAYTQINSAEIAGDNKLDVECYICHARGDHHSFRCPNGIVTVKLKNWNFEDFEKQNAREDATNPKNKYRLA